MQLEYCKVPYSGKLSREKTFTNFEVLQLFLKVFSLKLRGLASFGSDTSEQSVKVFSVKILFPPNREIFLPRKFLVIRYSSGQYKVPVT